MSRATCVPPCDECICQKSLFPVYMEAFPVQRLAPAGVSCFVHLMSQTTRRSVSPILNGLDVELFFLGGGDAFI